MPNIEDQIKSKPLLSKLFVTSDNKIVIGQSPNAPLIGALVLFGLSMILHGPVHNSMVYGYRICLIIWSVAEIGWGVNTFRRILGVAVFLLEIGALLGR